MDVPPCETSGDVAPGVPREPSLQGSGVEGVVLRGSLRAVSTTRLSKAPFFGRAGLSQVGLYRTHFCLCRGWGAEHLLRRPPSFGLKRAHLRSGTCCQKTEGTAPVRRDPGAGAARCVHTARWTGSWPHRHRHCFSHLRKVFSHLRPQSHSSMSSHGRTA